ncbi:efflux RND transporter periplasmic adaptor subunit [Tundrisphaera lichenicola]|uniref:efflux RND transporter periplasmic adaptor subunit n=1 Tax=Tundrisphaera lichenicola TaxID=2029860 RepID=UPI003EC010D8
MPRSISRRKSDLAFAVGLVAAFTGCERPISATAGPLGEPPRPPVARVEVVRPERKTIRRVVEEPGQVEAFEVTAIHARVAGYVESWSVNIGSKITKGQVMAELDVPELEAEVVQKRSMVDQAEALKIQSEASVEVAKADLDATGAKVEESRAGIRRIEAEVIRWQSESARVEQLFRERAQTGSLLDETRSKLESAQATREEYDAQVKTAQAAVAQAKAGLDKSKADVAAAEAGVAVARADAARVEALRGYTRILAPFDGVVTLRNVDVGHLTAPGAQGDPLFVVARSDLVTVVVSVPEMFAPAVEVGDPVTIRFQALPGKPIEGHVTRSAYALDPKSRTLRVEIDLPNPDGRLHPGLYAYASIVAEEHADVLTVPASAIVREGEKSTCVVIRGGLARRQLVEVGLGDGTSVEVTSGLGGDDLIVKANGGSIVDGQSVETSDPSSRPPKP